MTWYRKAAEQGNAMAQAHLGFMCDKGQGVPQDYATALRWYRNAAERRNTVAQNILGGIYALSQGVPEDCVIAHMWFNLAPARWPDSVAAAFSCDVSYR
jgi:TPR repeat protein